MICSIKNIAEYFGYVYTKSEIITGISTDSRNIDYGNLFFALKGNKFDGHDFISEAVDKGASAIICEKLNVNIKKPQFKVKNTILALSQLASYHRNYIKCPIIAITGSNAKTTTKEMVSIILPKPNYSTYKNFNNHIGVPKCVLNLCDVHRYAVFELGASKIGDIAHTASIVKPNVALVTNISIAHLSTFKSVRNIVSTKGEIYKFLCNNGTAIINVENKYSIFWNKYLKNKKILRISYKRPADIWAKNINIDKYGFAHFDLVLPTGYSRVNMNVPGQHVVYNAISAAACCYAVGINLYDIVHGLEKFTGVNGRLQFLTLKHNITIIDDTYNANYSSILVALNVLARRKGTKIFVIGDINEIGNKYAIYYHKKIGYIAKKYYKIDILLSYGIYSKYTSISFGSHAKHYVDKNILIKDLRFRLRKNTTILIKGSRSSHMETIVYALL